MSKENGFSEYKNLILSELERFGKKIDCLDHKLDEVRLDVVGLKTKAAVWGGVAGAVLASLVAIITAWVSKH